jgi:hypothetical protein
VNAVERLVALEEIRDLITRYSIAFDDHDWDDLAQLWTEDAAFVVAGRSFEPRDVLLDFLMTCLPADYFGKHMCSPSRVVLAPDGKSATAQTDVLWIAQNFENSIVGRYDDSFVHDGERWLFQRRKESTIAFKPGFPPYSEAALSVSGATMRKEVPDGGQAG